MTEDYWSKTEKHFRLRIEREIDNTNYGLGEIKGRISQFKRDKAAHEKAMQEENGGVLKEILRLNKIIETKKEATQKIKEYVACINPKHCGCDRCPNCNIFYEKLVAALSNTKTKEAKDD